MTYFPLSDEFHSAPELLGASDAAVALYARAASWSACHLTDGHVPSSALPLLTASYEQGSDELLQRRVWRRARGGFQFVSWPQQATRAKVEASREANRERQQKRRRSNTEPSRRDSRVTNAVTDGVTHGVSHASLYATPHHTTKEPPIAPQPGGETSTRKNRQEPARFSEFYDAYPRHKGRQAAVRAFAKAVQAGTDPQELINGAKRYRNEVAGCDPKFVKHPATWLNQGCWHDEPDLTAATEDWRRWCEQ